MRRSAIIILACLFSSFGLLPFAYSLPWPPTISVYSIGFNYESGYSNDALTIKKGRGSTMPTPEWITGNRNERFAYIKSQSSRKVRVQFYIEPSGYSNSNISVSAEVSGQGIGYININTVYFQGSQYSTPKVMTCQGSVAGSVDIRSFSWSWYAEAVNGNPLEDPLVIGTTGDHTYYILLAAPQAPMSEPWTDVLDYACVWAAWSTTGSSACTAILNNGFSAHYTWNMDCHRLSSDFIRLVTSLGISASQHRWSSKNQNVGDMSYQRTKSIDPVGSTWGQGVIEWAWHQWSEAASSQRDPSTATSKSGNWGGYEDDLFTHYEQRIGSYPYYQWVPNQSGQSSGCEAPEHRIYSSSPPVYDWRGPDR